MKTKLGKIVFESTVPTIDELIAKAHECSELHMEYVTTHKNTHLVKFVESEGWCAKIRILEGSIDIDDEMGMLEGPAVSQMILYAAKQFKGKGKANDKTIKFPLTFEGLKSYEAAYLKVRPKMPWVIRNTLLSAVGILIAIIVLIYFIL